MFPVEPLKPDHTQELLEKLLCDQYLLTVAETRHINPPKHNL